MKAAKEGGGGDGAEEGIGGGGGGLESAGEGIGRFVELIGPVGVEAFVPDGDDDGDGKNEARKAFWAMGHVPINSQPGCVAVHVL